MMMKNSQAAVTTKAGEETEVFGINPGMSQKMGCEEHFVS